MRELSMAPTFKRATSPTRRPAAWVHHHQRDAVAQSRNRREEARNLFLARMKRHFVRLTAVDDPLQRVLPLERDPVEKAQGAGHLVDVVQEYCLAMR